MQREASAASNCIHFNEQNAMRVALILAFTVTMLACEGSQKNDEGRGDGSMGTMTGQVAADAAVTGSAAGPMSSPPAMAKEQHAEASMSSRSTAGNAGFQAAPGRPATAGAAEIAPAMLIRTGNASIEVGKLDPAIARVRQLVAQLGGYVANSSITGGRDQVRSATLELKIPAARYDQAIAGLNGVGKVESVNTNVEDVGEEYVDIAARVTNSKRLEERLVSLLATRTGKLEDVLAVERELARVREEIERYEGRLRFLRTRAAVSTLTVTVHEPVPLLGQTPGENPIAEALRQAWRNFVGFIAALIASLGVLVPLAALGAAGWILFRRIRRKRTGQE